MAESTYSALKGEQLLLHYLIRKPRVPIENPPMVLMFHNHTTNETRPFAYCDVFPDEYLIISARAPFRLGNDSYTWFMMDNTPDGPVINAEQAEESRIMIGQFLNQVTELYRVDCRRVCLTGFYQGGIISASVALTHPGKVSTIAIVSGRILQEVRPLVTPSPQLSKLKALIIHGTTNDVIDISYARESRQYLRELGIEPTYQEYLAGHGVGARELVRLARFLREEQF